MKLLRVMVLATMASALLLSSAFGNPQVGVNQNAPNWWGVYNSGQPVDYWYYWGSNSAQSSTNCGPNSSYNCEVQGATSNVNLNTEPFIHTPTVFYLPGGYNTPPPNPIALETSNGGCPIEQNYEGDGIYYYNAPGAGGVTRPNSTNTPPYGLFQNLTTYITPPATPGFLISQAYTGIQGFTILGQTGNGSATGSASNAYALAAAYVSNYRCSNGDTEYGVYQDFTGNASGGNPNALIFYYSTNTNCDGYGECRNNPSGWNTSSPIYQQTTLAATITNVTNISNYGFFQYYSMYIVPNVNPGTGVSNTNNPGTSGFFFRIQILNQQAGLATCQVNGGAPCPCTTDFPINNLTNAQVWSLVNGAGYLMAGAQVSSASGGGTWPNFSGYPAFWVYGGWLGFNEPGF